MNRARAGLRLALQGLWFRRSSALIVLVLATVASAASVIAPLYARGAQESILRDALRRADPGALSVQVSLRQPGVGADPRDAPSAASAVETVGAELADPVFGAPRLSFTAPGLYLPTAGPFAGGEVEGQVVERAGLCENLPVTEGRCPAAPGEGMLARRSLDLVGAEIGDTIELEVENGDTVAPGAIPPVLAVRVVGAFAPVPVETDYWAGRPYFDAYLPRTTPDGLSVLPPRADPVFVAEGSVALARVSTYTVDVPVRAPSVHLDDADVVRAQVERLDRAVADQPLRLETGLVAALDRADAGRDIVRVAAPLAVAQLVLLSWWTLYLVVGSATEERSPELGLARLRGLSAGQTRRFGLAEVVLLLLAAAPLGTVLGWAAVRGAAGRVFAPGTEVLLTAPVILTLLGSLCGGVLTAALSSRQVFRRPVSDLLRRVPARRSGRRAGLVEAAVLVLAVAGVVQLVSDRGGRPSPVALLAPGLVAVAGGLLAARVLVRVARGRAARAAERGSAPALAGWASVARRPGTARIASVLAVATCLLLVGVQTWTVAERNRSERAAAETGAAVVLQVRADGPRELLETVRATDPGGRFAMAAVQVTGGSQEPTMLAVDGTRADRVLAWGAPDAAPSRPVASALLPDLPVPVVLRPGRLEVEVDLEEVDSPSPLRLTARLDDGGRVERVDLGSLRPGPGTYAGEIPPSCAGGCRLAAVAVDHPGTDIESASATLLLRSLSFRAGGAGEATALDTGFRRPGAWRPGTPTVGGPEVQIRPGEALRVTVRAPGGPFAEVVRGDSPEPLPAVTGRATARDAAAGGGLPLGVTTGVSGEPTRFRTVRAVPYVPRAGTRATMVDLDLALRLTEDTPEGDLQVWLARDDPRAEAALVGDLRRAGVEVRDRDSRRVLERGYAGDGAVLALRLLLVCGAAAVVVSVGALLVAAYVGRRQRAYEVAALRAVGLRRHTVGWLLVRENLGTVLVALGCGSVAAAVATWTLLPSLPQFDTPSSTLPVRYAPDAASAWAAVGGLASVLVLVGLAVATLQLRTGRPDRLREGVR